MEETGKSGNPKPLKDYAFDLDNPAFQALRATPVGERVDRCPYPILPGDKVLLLYGTYGIPMDIIIKEAGKRGMGVDIGEFQRLLDLERERSRKASKLGGAIFSPDSS